MSSALDGYEEAINKLNTLDTDNPKFDTTVNQIKMQRQEIIQYYPMLNKEKRKELLSKIDNDMDSGKLSVTSAKFGLLNDLRLRAKSRSEDRNLSKMMKKQSSNNSASFTAKGKPVVHAHKKQQSESDGWQKGNAPELEQESPQDNKKLGKNK